VGEGSPWRLSVGRCDGSEDWAMAATTELKSETVTTRVIRTILLDKDIKGHQQHFNPKHMVLVEQGVRLMCSLPPVYLE